MASPKILALAGLAATNLFWAGNAVIARFATTDIPPFTLAFYRWLIAFLLLLPFAWPHLRGRAVVIQERWPILLILGLLGIAIYNTILYLAAHTTTAINITLVSSSLPLITLLASWLMLRIRPGPWQIMGIAVSLLGVLIVVMRGDLVALRQLAFSQGDVLVFLIACVWSVYSVILRKYPIDLHPLALMAVFIAAGLPLLAVLKVLDAIWLPAFSFSRENIAIFSYVAIFPSLFSYLLWGYGVKVLGPNISALSCYLMPLFAVLLAVPLLEEALYGYHFVGGAMILLGLYLGVIFKQRSD